MLEKTANHRLYPDMVRHARHIRPQATDSADHQINFYAGIARLVQLLDQCRIDQRIHLGPDHTRFAGTDIGDFLIDQPHQVIAHVPRGHGDEFQLLGFDIAGDIVEQLCRIPRGSRISGEEAQIGVDFGRDRMIIAGPEMAIGAIAFLFLAHDHRYFRVRLPFDKPVNDLHARPFQRACPQQILLLVKACLEFDDRGYRFARFGRVNQRPDNRGLLACAIERLLDRHDVGIGSSLPQKFDHDLERFIRMVDQDILVTNSRKTIAAMIADPFRKARAIRSEFEIRAVFFNQYVEIADADQTVDPAFGSAVMQQMLAQHRDHRLCQLGSHFQPDDIAPAAAFDRAAEIAHKIFRLLLHFDIAVADYPEQTAAFHGIAGEQYIGKFLDGCLDRNVDGGFTGQANEARETGRDHHQFANTPIIRFPDQIENQTQSLVGNERKWMGRIKRLGSQYRKYLVEKMLSEPGFGIIGKFAHGRNKNIFSGQGPGQGRPYPLLMLEQRVGADRDRFQLLSGCQTIGRTFLDVLAILTDQPGKADHEELVQIATGDRQEAQPLEQRMRVILSLFDNPLVKAQPAYFPIEIAFAGIFRKSAAAITLEQ